MYAYNLILLGCRKCNKLLLSRKSKILVAEEVFLLMPIIRPWATWSSGTCPWPWQKELGLDSLQDPFLPLPFCFSGMSRQDLSVLIKLLEQSSHMHAGPPFFSFYLRTCNLAFYLFIYLVCYSSLDCPDHFDSLQPQWAGWFHSVLAHFFFFSLLHSN